MRKKQKTKKHSLISFLVIVTLVSISVSSALILLSTEPKTNTFISGKISCEVQEDYTIKNTGNTSSYIRAEIIVNFIDENNNIYGEIPEYTITLGQDWEQLREDGYYYYKEEVKETESTTGIISEITTGEVPEGYTLNITILSEAIQSTDGNKAIENAWGIEAKNLVTNT